MEARWKFGSNSRASSAGLLSARASSMICLRQSQGGSSLNFIEKMSTQDLVKMIRRYDPRPLMEAVRDHVDGFHIFTFNAIQTTDQWIEQTPWLRTLVEAHSQSLSKA